VADRVGLNGFGIDGMCGCNRSHDRSHNLEYFYLCVKMIVLCDSTYCEKELIVIGLCFAFKCAR
jgi:hypothetical protein